MIIYGKILSTDRLPVKEEELRQRISLLPFGKAEQARLLSRSHLPSLAQSLTVRLALAELMQTLGLSPRSMIRDREGKPRFEGALAPSFSLSHAKNLGLAILTEEDTPIGADLELFSPLRREEPLVTRFFSADRQARWADAADPRREFLRLWTEMEAIAKCEGQGLAPLLRQDVSFPPHSLRSFTIQTKDQWGVITLCAQKPITEIQWITDQKEITVYEIQN